MTSPLNTHPPLLAIDPGREKCGIAVVSYERRVLEREIVSTETLPFRIAHFVGKYGIDLVVIGDRTGAQEVRDSIRRAGMRMEIAFVDEHRSSEFGRRAYLLANRGAGWQRFLPVGLRTPDQPYDDYVAVILAERYLDGQRSTRIRRPRKRNA